MVFISNQFEILERSYDGFFFFFSEILTFARKLLIRKILIITTHLE